MYRKLVSIMLVIAIFGSGIVVSAAAAPTREDDEKRTEKVRTEIRKLGTGPEARIKLKLRDKTELEGYISEAGDDDFTVIRADNGNAATIPYPQVGKARGNNLSSNAKIAISVGISLLATYLSYKFGRNRRYRRHRY